MTITFVRDFYEALEARVSFLNLSKASRRARRLEFYLTTIFFLVMMLVLAYPHYQSSVQIGNKSYPVIGTWTSFLFYIFVSFFMGWFFKESGKLSRRAAIVRKLRHLHPDSFGPRNVTIDQTGLTIQSPLTVVKYDWKAVSSLQRTPKYLFFCLGTDLITSIPISSLGNKLADFIEEAQKWTSVVVTYK